MPKPHDQLLFERSLAEHKRLCLWWEWLFGGVADQAEAALRALGIDDLA